MNYKNVLALILGALLLIGSEAIPKPMNVRNVIDVALLV